MSEAVIWKYGVQPSHEPIRLNAPHGARPVALEVQGDALSMWAAVNPDAPLGWFEVMVIGTGWPFDPARWEYVATAQTPGLFIWHLLRAITTTPRKGKR